MANKDRALELAEELERNMMKMAQLEVSDDFPEGSLRTDEMVQMIAETIRRRELEIYASGQKAWEDVLGDMEQRIDQDTALGTRSACCGCKDNDGFYVFPMGAGVLRRMENALGYEFKPRLDNVEQLWPREKK